MNAPHFQELAQRLGCELSEDSSATWVVARGGARTRLRYTPRTDADGRLRNFGVLLGTRLGLDRLLSTPHFEEERPTGKERPRNAYETPSVYGTRIQYLLPRQGLLLAQELSGEEFVAVDWAVPELCVAYLREQQRSWHLFAESDFEHVEFDRDNLIKFGRLALFYESYKPRPKAVKVPGGVLRYYRSAEGMTASRSTLLPDYDYDAAQSQGFASIPSRDCMIVAEVDSADARDQVHQMLTAAAEEELQATNMPFSKHCFSLSTDKISPIGLPDDDNVWDGCEIEVLDVDLQPAPSPSS